MLCVKHGGGRRCNIPGCTKVARGRTNYCASHRNGEVGVVAGQPGAAVGGAGQQLPTTTTPTNPGAVGGAPAGYYGGVGGIVGMSPTLSVGAGFRGISTVGRTATPPMPMMMSEDAAIGRGGMANMNMDAMETCAPCATTTTTTTA